MAMTWLTQLRRWIQLGSNSAASLDILQKRDNTALYSTAFDDYKVPSATVENTVSQSSVWEICLVAFAFDVRSYS